MWLFGTEHELESTGEPETLQPLPLSASSGGKASLGRYRTYGRFYERYWSKLFGVTEADMSRFADRIRVSGSAPTLTDLVQEVIRARLQEGPQLHSGPAPEGDILGRTVGRWDPCSPWCVGDRVVLAVAGPAGEHPYVPRLGEITEIGQDRAVIQVDGLRAPQVYPLGRDAFSPQDMRAHTEMTARVDATNEAAQVESVLWEHGQHVAGRLLDALEADARFVELEGRWYLRDLATKPGEHELDRLAAVMFDADSPMTLSDALMHLDPESAGTSLSRRFGLGLALREHRQQFRNVGTATYPRWELASPPPVALEAHHAVYDPKSYAILCMPGDVLDRRVGRRLWDLGLLRAAIAPVDTAVAHEPSSKAVTAPDGGIAQLRAEAEIGVGEHTERPSVTPTREADEERSWPRWLRFSRH